MDVSPTIYYRQKAGHLVETVEATLRFMQPSPLGSVVLLIAGQRYERHMDAVNDFGEERLEYEVPEWNGTIPARLEVNTNKRATFSLSLTAARKWTVFVVPHTHLDVGFTDYVGKVAEIQSRELEEALGLIHEHPDFRFTTDGSWDVQQFLATRSNRLQQEFLGAVRRDQLGVPANYANLLTGYASLETLYRSLYYSKWLSRTYGTPFDYASTTDVPTYSGAYPSILASAGIKYWVAGPNADRAPFRLREKWNQVSPFWWEGPDGKKVLFWYARAYREMVSIFGLPPQVGAGYDSLPIFLGPYSNDAYKPDAVLLNGSQEENVTLYPQTASVVGEWNKKFAYPKMRYATFEDFFSYIDERYGRDLPHIRATWDHSGRTASAPTRFTPQLTGRTSPARFPLKSFLPSRIR